MNDIDCRWLNLLSQLGRSSLDKMVNIENPLKSIPKDMLHIMWRCYIKDMKRGMVHILFTQGGLQIVDGMIHQDTFINNNHPF
jgi:hypothetical protein